MTRERWLYYSGRLTEVRDADAAMELYREVLEREGSTDDREVGAMFSTLMMKADVMGFADEILERMPAFNREHGVGLPDGQASPADSAPGPDRAA